MKKPEEKTKVEDAAAADLATASIAQMFSNADAIDYCFMALGTLGSLMVGVSFPIMDWLFGKLLNSINESGDFVEDVNQLCLYLVYIAIGNIVGGYVQVYGWTYSGERQTQKFRERYVNAILSQEIGWFDDCGAGELSTRVAEVIGKIQDGSGRKIGDSLQYLTQIIGSFTLAFVLNWKLTLVMLAAFPLIFGSGFFMIQAVTEAQNTTLGQYAAAGGLATESLGAVRTVSALNAQPDVINKYRVYLFEAMHAGIHKGLKVGFGNGSFYMAFFLASALGYWYSGKLIADGISDGCTSNCPNGGQLTSVFFTTIMGSMALGQIAPPIIAFVAALAAVRKVLDISERKPLIDGLSSEGDKPATRPQGVIQIKDVNFAYPTRPDIVVCRDYNLRIEAGESVALVGMSGSGKSTIINLLLRFYDPQSGVVSLDGHDIKKLNIRWLRNQIGYVGQEPILFSGTIADNISYGLPPELLGETAQLSVRDDIPSSAAATSSKLSKEELRARVIAAAKLANAHDFISDFPQGYDTDVGTGGTAMSGGQKQRIAIARALIKKPSVLLLDEATSALDATSERVVQESIDALQSRKEQTTIIIAHRLSTIRNADKICLISAGQIAEMGTHDELIAKNGLYADLVRLQMSGHDEEVHAEESPVEEAEEVADKIEAEDALVSAAHVAAAMSSLVPGTTNVYNSVASLASEQSEESISKEAAEKASSRIWAMVREQTGWMLVASISALIFGGLMPAWGMLMAYAQNMFFLTDAGEIREKAALYAYLFIMLAVLALASATGMYYGVAQVAERLSIQLRSSMFEALMRREITFFDREENGTGALTTQLSDNSRIVNKAFGENFARQLQAVSSLILGFVLGFIASWKIALVVIAAFPLNIFAGAIQSQAMAGQQFDDASNNDAQADAAAQNAAKSPSNKKDKSKKEKVEKTDSSKTVDKTASATTVTTPTAPSHGSLISTAFIHMRTVSAFSMQHKVSEQYANLTRAQSEMRSRSAIIGGIGFGIAMATQYLTNSLLFWYGAQLIDSGEINFLQLMQAMMVLLMGAFGIGTAMADLGDQRLGIETAARIFKMIDEGALSPIDGLSTTGARPEGKATGRIVLKDVNFRYPTRPDVRVCKGLNLTIEPGEMVAFVGPSGSGKSTVINLLLRYYDPLSGSVSIDGRDIKDLNVRWLRSQIGYVGQEPVLFAGSVQDNIAKGREGSLDQPVISLQEAMLLSDAKQEPLCAQFAALCGSSHAALPVSDSSAPTGTVDVELGNAGKHHVDDDIVETCKASNAHDFIQTFPKGYDTDIGEGSIMVSGGQKQRIAIARALIKKPTILLLDEATSALDATSERVVQESIDALQRMKAQTTIVIAHRLTTIRHADKIVVIDKGSVVESGKHEELLAQNGLYATLWNKQSGADTKTAGRVTPTP